MDADHFLRELAGNLGRGRAFVRTKREFELQASVSVHIEAPGVDWTVPAEAVVVFSRDGFVGLEFEDFEQTVLPQLDRLGQQSERAKLPASEATVIGPMPRFDSAGRRAALEESAVGAAEVHITDEEPGGYVHMRALPPIETEPDEELPGGMRALRDRSSTIIQEAPPKYYRAEITDDDGPRRNDPPAGATSDDLVDLDDGDRGDEDDDDLVGEEVDADGTQDLNLYDERQRRRRVPSSPTMRLPVAQPQSPQIADDDEGTFDLPKAGVPVSKAAAVDPAEAAPHAPPDLVHEYEPWSPAERSRAMAVSPSITAKEAAPSPPPPPAPAPPAAPAIAAEGLAVFEDRERSFLRSTGGGVLRIGDERDLLGLYLLELRHGLLITLGGPDGAVGEKLRLKVACGRVVTLEAEVLARLGDWVTLAVPDAGPVKELLTEKSSELAAILGELGVHPTAPPPPPPPPPPIEPEKPRPEPEPERPRSAGMGTAVLVDEPPPPPKAIEPAAPEPAPKIEPVAERPARAPKPPKLAGDTVAFEETGDLENELKANLKSGGLFVESSPIPLRTKKKLAITVGGRATGLSADAEVVFADAGKVGFMVTNGADLIPKLEHFLASGPPPAEEGTADVGSLEDSGIGAAVVPFKGKVAPPLTMGRILDFHAMRVEDESELAETTVLQLFDYLVRHDARGVIEVESGADRLSIWLHEGSVAFVVKKPLEEHLALGRLLINLKRLNEAGLRQALETAKQAKKPLGRTLVAMGLIKKADLSTAVREQMRVVLDAGFAWKSGRYEWQPWREPPGEADLILTKGIGILAHHFRGRYEALGSSEMEILFGQNMPRRAAPSDDLDRLAGVVQLQPKELRFIQHQLDGTRPMNDAVLGSPIGRLASLRLIGVLLSLGQLHFTDGKQKIMREATSVRREPSTFVRLKKELQERLGMFKGMNHFEILGVHWSAHHRGHKQAYDKLKKEFDPTKAPIRDTTDDIRAIAKEINDLLDAAWATISSPEKRQSYRKELFDKTERQYAADMLVKQGEVALMRGNRVAAIEALETAVELEPSARNRQLLASAREGRR
jgi:hypothetical protein